MEGDGGERRLEDLGAIEGATSALEEARERHLRGGGGVIEEGFACGLARGGFEGGEEVPGGLAGEEERDVHSERPPSTTRAWPTM